ncbi:alpha/beta fold hydrolase [Ignatzschineria cameli]|uniref:alpha/beta fold hydrolase n=1 Tax=Ignatzschineria cameli TaxID=2182793 RepID=UPI0013007CEE|nr:alpha/beta fold hydrolase [Ignatzschineria cameli]
MKRQEQRYNDKINYLYVAGETPRDLILLVHPLGMNRHVWNEVIAHFETEYDLLALDLPGHGDSPAPSEEEQWRIEALAEMVLRLVDQLGYQRFHYVGTSIGGAIGQEILLLAPERLKSLMITNSSHKIGETSAWESRAADVRQIGLAEMAPTIVPRWFASDYLESAIEEIEDWKRSLAATSNEGYAQLCEALGAWSATDRLPNRDQSVPVLCLAGSEDKAMALPNMEQLADLMGERELEILAVGHVPSVEASAQFNQILSEWLAAAR